MNVLRRLFIGIALLGIGFFLFTWWDNRNYFEAGKTGTFTIAVDETVKFQLSENGSTGYQNCWINASACKSVALVSKNYSSSLSGIFGYVGAGGRITFTFKGITKGVDTIQIASCPTGREGKDCSEFSTKSVEADNSFIVKVE